MAEAVGGEDAAAVVDAAALIPDAAMADAVRRRSPIDLAPRVNARGDAIAPMTPVAFINPAVIHRTWALMRRVLPSSGFGPSGDRLEEWSWRLTADAGTAGGRHVRIDVLAEGHPGYLTTAKLLGEVGLLLAERGGTPERAGCLTPATALGTASLDRFERAGVRFAVSS